MGERTTHRPGRAVFGGVDWLVRIAVPVTVGSAYGLPAGIATGTVLVAASEVGWRILTGEWGNLWPSRMVMAHRRRPR
jgi:hypothetical protein